MKKLILCILCSVCFSQCRLLTLADGDIYGVKFVAGGGDIYFTMG